MALMSSGTGTGMDNSISKVWEREGNEKSTSPYNSGTGRKWKNSFPNFGNGNQRFSFLGMIGNGNSCSPLILRVRDQWGWKSICLLWIACRCSITTLPSMVCNGSTHCKLISSSHAPGEPVPLLVATCLNCPIIASRVFHWDKLFPQKWNRHITIHPLIHYKLTIEPLYLLSAGVHQKSQNTQSSNIFLYYCLGFSKQQKQWYRGI